MSGNNLLKIGWRNDDLLWVNLNSEGKDSIREFVATVSGYKLSNGPNNMDAWLKKSLPHFYDRRYNDAIPRFGATPFWSFVNDFALVTNRLIMKNYCNVGGVKIIQSMQVAVSTALERHTMLLSGGPTAYVD